MRTDRQIPIGRPPHHRGYRNSREYRDRLLRSAWPFVGVAFLVFGFSILGADDPGWVLFAGGWVVAAICLAIAALNPQLWLVAPYGALAAIVLIRWGTDGPDAGIGPLVLIPIVTVALYGSRMALAAMFATATVVIAAFHLGPGETELVVSPVWRQDLIMLVMAITVAVGVQTLVSRLRVERRLSEARGERLVRVSEITRVVSTSAEPTRTLCEMTVELTEARGAALFRHHPDGPRLMASTGADPGRLDELAAGPVAGLLDGLDQGDDATAVTIHRDAGPELESLRRVWRGFDPSVVVCAAARSDRDLTGLLLLAWPDDASPEDSAVPLDLLAAEASISIRNQELTERLERLALTDPLTGVANRRGWDQHITAVISTAGRHQRPLSVAILDLDGFKSYNDRLGHRAGDLLLREYVARWQHVIRASDHLARFGGDEFVATFPDTDLEEATIVAQRMCGGSERGVRASAGVARWDGSEAAAELLDRADRALYEAKHRDPGSVRTAASGTATSGPRGRRT